MFICKTSSYPWNKINIKLIKKVLKIITLVQELSIENVIKFLPMKKAYVYALMLKWENFPQKEGDFRITIGKKKI